MSRDNAVSLEESFGREMDWQGVVGKCEIEDCGLVKRKDVVRTVL